MRKKEGINIMYRKFLFGHRPARQCLSEQNSLDNLDSKKVTQQKRLGIMAMAGGSEEYVVYLGCGYTFEDDQGGVSWKGQIRE
jgi:hypothetical protein